METAFIRAVRNVAKHGDTDVFPYPVENHVFYDDPNGVVELLKELHRDFERSLTEYPPVTEQMLAAVGYTGFRWATQIDPLWNVYFLALVLAIGEDIEAARIPLERGTVFSYRFHWDDDDASMFRRDIGWRQFQERSVELARECSHVLICDISDFYPRIYHHRLENALKKAAPGADAVWRIDKLLMQFSAGVSYGLPVGGPAARLLSELLLNRVDRLLITAGVTFCRFADDYHVFADSEEEAYQHLVFLSEKLMLNEGLLLQKSKTRVMSSQEFLATSDFASENEPDGPAEEEAREFLRLRLFYDPYSPTAEADYEALKTEVEKFDISGMIAREMRKSRIQQSLARKLIGAIRLLEDTPRDETVLSVMENLATLYPVYSSIMIMLRGVVDDLAPATRRAVFGRLRGLINEGSYIVQVPTHLAYSVRILGRDPSEEAEEVLVNIYSKTQNTAIRRDVILAMAHRNADYWISDVRKSFGTVSQWERTSILVASYILGDEGQHWRAAVKGEFTPLQGLIRDWAANRAAGGATEIPI